MNEITTGLGAHIDAHLDSHVTEHGTRVHREQEQIESGKLERQSRANELYDKMSVVMRETESTEFSAGHFLVSHSCINRLDNGTVLGGELRSKKSPLSIKNGLGRYISLGESSSKKFTGKTLEDSETSELTGVDIYASLRSHDEQTNIRTESQLVIVGRLLDPESILVPEQDEDGQRRFSVIGPKDERFTPIIDMIGKMIDPTLPEEHSIEEVASGQAIAP